MEQDCLLQNLTAADLRARAAKAPAIILPLASIEILGAHGPVGLDAVNRWNGTPFRTFSNFHAYCIGGAWGDTTAASAEKGRALIDCGVEAIAAFLSEAFMQESAGQ